MSISRFLIVVCDGLRPDLIDKDLMPTLWRLRRDGAFAPNARAVFPSETRVNAVSLVTGCLPGTHGVVSNIMFDRSVPGGRWIDTGRRDDLDEMQRMRDGNLFSTPSLGEILRRNQASLAVIGTGSSGTTRLLHHTADIHQHLNVWVEGLRVPRTLEDQRIVARFGAPPSFRWPNVQQVDYATNLYLEHVEPALRPTVAIVWFSDPDGTFHYHGIGSPAACAALRAVDNAVGRLALSVELSSDLNLLVLSDHGHITAGGKMDVGAALDLAALRIPGLASQLEGVACIHGYCGAMYRRPGAGKARIGAVAEWLKRQEWIGAVCVRPSAVDGGSSDGYVALHAIGADHPCGPDIIYTMRSWDSRNEWDIAGMCLADGYAVTGRGVHGGMHRAEMNNLLIAYGPAFPSGRIFEEPCGIIDVIPSVLELLRLDGVQQMDGAALLGVGQNGGVAANHTIEVGDASYRQRIILQARSRAVYLEEGGGGVIGGSGRVRQEV